MKERLMPVQELDSEPGRRRGRAGSRPGGYLLFQLVNDLLLLVDLVSEPGQLPVVGLPVRLHLQFQSLLQTSPR